MGAGSSRIKHLLQGGAAQEELAETFKSLDKDHDQQLSLPELEKLALAVFRVLKQDPGMAQVHVPFTNHTFMRWSPKERYYNMADAEHDGECVSTHVARALLTLMGGPEQRVTMQQFMAFDWPHVVDQLEKAAAAEQQRVRDRRPYATPEIKFRFEEFCRQNELSALVENQIYQILSTTEVVLVCDDSGSMANQIFEPNKPPTTRWLELKRLAAAVIDVVTSVNPAGLDIYFFNRPSLRNVTSTAGLQQVFQQEPGGGTPLLGTLRNIYREKQRPDRHPILIVIISDGEPSDGNHRDFFSCLMQKPDNFHISMAECTDNPRDMEYLDKFDGRIPNFDNTDDYREELARVRAVNGPLFKFDYSDYVLKILLASFLRWYFMLDQRQPTPKWLIGVYPVEFEGGE